ncbi:capsular polysaccharide biosynthesis protein [Tropicimonas sp. IMCC6043]|uniref:capsular polysaccharide biosynthesis protein n=1 Tax=Tropicimonas sp. IMCC6043 TaxID=2510645 RepID=UPI00101BC129|nr:capsular polysaccharide biosynthesis protein [Tropicimonas sp. IMCC6043]RYH08419.1 capsular polysaccharide biosynthesis protein [Tropicimonas sp. IMCC6043]
MTAEQPHSSAESAPRRLFVYDGGFATRRIRRILALAGWQVTTGRPGRDDWIGVWGHGPTAWRGEAVARRTGARILRVEDALLRSLRTGRDGEAPTGLLLDRLGVHYDSGQPSELEETLANAPLDDTALLERARAAMARMRKSEISKYNTFDTDLDPPEPGYVLVVDQTVGDASIRGAGAKPERFREMLALAQIEHPGARILICSLPETCAGHRRGHFGPGEASEQVALLTAPHSPWRLLEGAVAVYTVSSQFGFEAILAGHRPRVFGQPFYAGWGLTEDEAPPARRQRRLTRSQLFAAAMILHPTWYDPWRDRLCELEDVLDGFDARLRAFREDRHGYVATGMRLWKRGHLRRFYGSEGKLTFGLPPGGTVLTAMKEGCPILGWAGRIDPQVELGAAAANVPLLRVEDGFLHSRGLGTKLVPPISLVRDDLGIYYDPSRESRLERLIAASTDLPDGAIRRAERLQVALTRAALTKYTTGTGTLPDLPKGRRILVPGQVEDDESIRLGCGEIRSNSALLEAVRAANPDAVLIYKPHPDVDAGLRAGALPEDSDLADLTLRRTDPAALIAAVDEVWTLTSLLGFEALLRGRSVTCLGAPFYAGWGLTTDLGPVPERRRARPSLAGLIHAALIDYPRYLDPVTGLPCPVEVAVERLAAGISPRANPLFSKIQGLFASHRT